MIEDDWILIFEGRKALRQGEKEAISRFSTRSKFRRRLRSIIIQKSYARYGHSQITLLEKTKEAK